MIHKLIYTLGTLIRNPSYSKAYSELKKTEFASKAELESIQLKRLNEILVFANTHSPYYRKRINNVINDGPLICLEQIKELPIVTKRELIDYNNEIHTVNSYNFKKTFFSETSGSSGQALTFLKDEPWDSYNRASIARGLSWYNILPYDRNGYFWGYAAKNKGGLKVRFLDFLMNRFRMFSYKDEEVLRFLKKAQKAKYLHGYSSMLYEISKIANNKGIKIDNIRLIKGTSEKIYPHYSTESLKAFDKPIISEYGAAESGIIAFECPMGSMHINEETCIVEEVDGEIIFTNLIARSFPIIRYTLGDSISISNTPCPCGRSHKVISEVIGRVGKNIYGKSGNKYPSLTLYYIFKIMALENNLKLNYKGVQRHMGKLELLITCELSKNEKELLIESAYRYYGDDVEITIKENAKIHDKTKKLKDFESYII